MRAAILAALLFVGCGGQETVSSIDETRFMVSFFCWGNNCTLICDKLTGKEIFCKSHNGCVVLRDKGCK